VSKISWNVKNTSNNKFFWDESFKYYNSNIVKCKFKNEIYTQKWKKNIIS